MEDNLTRHSIWVNRYASGLYKNEMIPIIEEMRDRIIAKLQANDVTASSAKRLEIILNDIDLIIQNSFAPINPSLWKELAEYENEYSVKLLDDSTTPSVVISTGLNPTALTALTVESTVQFAGDNPMTIEAIVKTLSDRYSKDIKNEIQMGIASGDNLQEITARVKSLSDSRTRQQSEAVVRTVTNHISNAVRSEVFSGYGELFKGVQWRSTLDSRTSPTCMSRDGKIYPINNHPTPPAHWNCRSLIVYLVKDEYDLMKGATTRSAQGGPISSEATYNDWLKRQSNAVQNEILGNARAEAYRKSGESIDRFIDRKGEFYTLDELRAKDLLK